MGTDVTGSGRSSASEPSDGLAPVIPLFGARPAAGRPTSEAPPHHEADLLPEPLQEAQGAVWRSTWEDDVVARGRRSGDAPESPHGASGEGVPVALAEKQLLKKLRTRSLSILEARGVLLGLGTAPADVDLLIEAFVNRGYLDDAALAEQLVHIGLDRKGQGRRVIAQILAQRGVPRDVTDAALLALPDDDSERALDFARGRARSLRSLDRETALRRLTGQLARRGYGGSVAFDAARVALDEVGV